MKDKIFNSIINSSREFDEIHVTNVNRKSFPRVLQVLIMYKDKIRSLQLATLALSKSELINLLNELRCLNEIVIKSIKIRSLDNRDDDTRIKKSNSRTKSNKINSSVKTVFLDQHCDRNILSILNDLPTDSIDNLVLRFPTNDMQALQTFLCKQNQLKQFSIYTNFIQSISISHLHLTHLTIEARKIAIDTIRSQQQSLKYLCIMNFPLNDDDIFEEICNLEILKVLKIYIGNISSDKIESVARLRNLEELTIKSAAKSDEEGQLTTFCSFSFPLLSKFVLHAPNLNISEEFLRILGSSFGAQLTLLKIEKISIASLFVIIECFERIEYLEVFILDKTTSTFDYDRFNYLRHKNINFLSIKSNCSDLDFSKLFIFFPNIQNLTVNKTKLSFPLRGQS